MNGDATTNGPTTNKPANSDEAQSKKAWEVAGVLVPAGLLIGMGVGWMFGSLVPGLFIGLGGGLFLMAVIRLLVGR